MYFSHQRFGRGIRPKFGIILTMLSSRTNLKKIPFGSLKTQMEAPISQKNDMHDTDQKNITYDYVA